MEGLKLCDADLVVHVHPSKSKKVAHAVLHELSSLLFKFNENFDGVVLAYSMDVRSELAKILPGVHPYFGVTMKSKLLLFNPKPNMLIEGKVVKLGQQSIHAVVLGFSSAIIIEEDIRDEFEYKVKHGKELYASTSHKRHMIEVGSIIRFIVKKFDEEVLHISGSLLEAHTGSVHWLDKNMEDNLQTNRIKKRKESGQNKEMAGKESNPVNTNHSIKKSKRKHSDS